jgi:chemotaxis protein MotA
MGINPISACCAQKKREASVFVVNPMQYKPAMWHAPFALSVLLVAASVWFGWHHPIGILLVLVGTAVGIWQSFGSSALLACWHTLQSPPTPTDANTLTSWLLAIQAHERQHGLLTLQQARHQAPCPLLAKGLTYLADNRPAEWITHQLQQMAQAQQRHLLQTIQVLETAAGLTPTMGILGGLASLMLTQGQLTPGDVAPAFTATFLGVGLANLVLLPLASRITALANVQTLSHDTVIEGLLSIQAGEHRLLLLDRLAPSQDVGSVASLAKVTS